MAMARKDERVPCPELSDSRAAWFMVLDRALMENDEEQERIARRELARLGVAIYIDEEKLGFRAAAGGGR